MKFNRPRILRLLKKITIVGRANAPEKAITLKRQKGRLTAPRIDISLYNECPLDNQETSPKIVLFCFNFSDIKLKIGITPLYVLPIY